MQLGVIADDFTGATDIASFLVANGLSTVQVVDVPAADYQVEADAVVISLKSRSCPPDEAIEKSLAALRWLQARGCQQFYFKYCSTFDSTQQGNIGPVTDALLDALGEEQTIISPALPVNGRTVYQGYLFVLNQLLSESGMRHHPITPMTDSNLLRLMEGQARGKAGLVPYTVMDQGVEAVQYALQELKQQGVRYVVLDTLNEQHLLTQGAAVKEMKLVTGGSGLAIGLARQWADGKSLAVSHQPVQGKTVVLSGSCSTMTNQQVAEYQQQAPTRVIDVTECVTGDRDTYAQQLCQWIEEQAAVSSLAPMLYATTNADNLQKIHQTWGVEVASQAIEQLFAIVAGMLQQSGFTRFIVAGGETSGIVVQSLNIQAFSIGPTISPGVPWVTSTDHPISLALKSGNFGDVNFFARAQLEF